MAQATSAMDHIMAMLVSQVKSPLTVAFRSVVALIMEMAQVLRLENEFGSLLSVCILSSRLSVFSWRTYKKPKQKTKIRISFWISGRRMLLRSGRGMTNMATFVRTWMMALASQKLSRAGQFLSAFGSQFLEIGQQINTEPIPQAMAHIRM